MGSPFTEQTRPAAEGVSLAPQVGVRLVIETPGKDPRVWIVAPDRALSIGRGSDQDLALEDSEASRTHAVVRFDGHRAEVEDLQSSNGTWLNNARLRGTHALHTGDVVRVGATTLVVALVSTESDGREDQPRPALRSDEIAEDPATLRMFRLLARLAPTEITVLLQGETGCGKEVAARALHRRSSRAAGPFVAINCAAIPEALAESELFGHERGSFTGALARRIGAFESAHNGTLLLDEVGDLSPTSQARLLRALQEKTITRVGSNVAVPVDVRVVTATHRDLLAEVASGAFRSDLYFRLDGATVVIPPLRSRPRDIAPIVERVLAEASGGRVGVGPGVLAALVAYRWPGNVRELKNAIERAVALCDGAVLNVANLPPAVRGEGHPAAAPEGRSALRDHVAATERGAILAALEAAEWNQSQAARALGITRRALIYRMELHGLKARPGGAAG